MGFNPRILPKIVETEQEKGKVAADFYAEWSICALGWYMGSALLRRQTSRAEKQGVSRVGSKAACWQRREAFADCLFVAGPALALPKGPKWSKGRCLRCGEQPDGSKKEKHEMGTALSTHSEKRTQSSRVSLSRKCLVGGRAPRFLGFLR